MAARIRTVHYGVGAIGSEIVRLAGARKDLKIVGAVDIAQDRAGKDLGLAAGLERRLGVSINARPETVLVPEGADVVIHSTRSSLTRVAPELQRCIEADMDVVSTCEELAYPWASHPRLARKLDELARQHAVSIVGTGVNPGFVMDTLALALTAPCQNVRRIRITRVVDSALRRIQLQRKTGASLTVEEFREKVALGTIRHVGLRESMLLVADALFGRLTRIEESIEPVVAAKPRRSQFFEVVTGKVAGVHQVVTAFVGDKEVIRLELEISIGAEDPRDAVLIEADPDIDMVIRGGVFGDTATAAIALNCIPRVLQAAPGLLSMKDLALVYNARRYEG
ncbi:MAG: dihydrodipicolinate reductase [Chloroflexi bacterium]|nr:dihydrodipicolinate reductase [Chloroflexota bacterium]